MTNKLILEGLAEASSYLNQVEGLPLEQQTTLFNLADGVLTNIKAFVSNGEAWQKINEFEQKIHRDFSIRLKTTRKQLEDIDPMYQWQDGLKYMMDLRMWKTRETLAFWDKITKEYDL